MESNDNSHRAHNAGGKGLSQVNCPISWPAFNSLAKNPIAYFNLYGLNCYSMYNFLNFGRREYLAVSPLLPAFMLHSQSLHLFSDPAMVK